MQKDLPNRVLEAVRKALPDSVEKTGLHEPCFPGRELEYVGDCIRTGWVSSVGSYVDRFEAMLSEYTGARYAIATVNGTAALHVALLLAGVKPGDEVLLPALTFVATANAIVYCGAVPHFVDSCSATLGVDAKGLRAYLDSIAVLKDGVPVNRKTGRVLRALVPMHVFGHPADVVGLQRVCEDYSLVMVEDAAESLGSFYHGRHTGNFGLLAAMSFNGNKIVTTGGGGAILTNDAELAKRAKHLTTTARTVHRWEIAHDCVGYNYRLPNINAALGCAQMEALPSFVERKRRLAQRYAEVFAGETDVSFVAEPENTRSNYWLNAICLSGQCASERDAVLGSLNEHGLMARPSWTPMHCLPMYTECPRAPLPVTESLAARLINLPSSAMLGETDV